MEKPIRVQCSPLTETIYAGRVSKDGKSWLSDRTDVTSGVLGAIIAKVGVGNVLTVTTDKKAYEIEVRDVSPLTVGGA